MTRLCARGNGRPVPEHRASSFMSGVVRAPKARLLKCSLLRCNRRDRGTSKMTGSGARAEEPVPPAEARSRSPTSFCILAVVGSPSVRSQCGAVSSLRALCWTSGNISDIHLMIASRIRSLHLPCSSNLPASSGSINGSNTGMTACSPRGNSPP